MRKRAEGNMSHNVDIPGLSVLSSRETQHIINNLFWRFQLCSRAETSTSLFALSRSLLETRILILPEKSEKKLIFENRYIAICRTELFTFARICSRVSFRASECKSILTLNWSQMCEVIRLGVDFHWNLDCVSPHTRRTGGKSFLLEAVRLG